MQNNLFICEKSSNFARFLQLLGVYAPSGGGRFPRLTGTPPGAIWF